MASLPKDQTGGPKSDTAAACRVNKMREHCARFAPVNHGSGRKGGSSNKIG
jgi:hypothetical protein